MPRETLSDRVVVELEAVEALAPIHWVQVRPYLKATGCLLGLLIDFNVPVFSARFAESFSRPTWRPGVLALE